MMRTHMLVFFFLTCVMCNGVSSDEDVENEINEDIAFYLYTRDDMDHGIRLTLNEFNVSNDYFDKTKDTKFIIHGFRHSKDAEWVVHIRKALCMKNKWNVIVVDWSPLARVKYSAARKNTFTVGKHVAKLCDILAENGVAHSTIHIIGHSLGAHIAGYAGTNVNYGKISRITGLDPARPWFEMPFMVAHDRRLDQTDAAFVDVIHTNAGGFGCETPIGHVDFYPNGGKTQPGCKSWKCSHVQACEFWTRTIYNPLAYLGYKCNSYLDFLDGSCRDQDCVVMGLATNPDTRGKYYLNTTYLDGWLI